jgi:hypothetical protein
MANVTQLDTLIKSAPTASSSTGMRSWLPSGLESVLQSAEKSLPSGTETMYGDDLTFSGSGAYVTKNPNYRVVLVQNGASGGLSNFTLAPSVGENIVVANSPTDFSLSLTNNYIDLTTVLSSMFSGGLSPAAQAADAMTKLAGAGLAAGVGMPLLASMQIWSGTGPLEFELPLSFRAYKNPKTEVIDPVRKLIQMASPRKAGPVLTSPGPNIMDMGGSKIVDAMKSASPSGLISAVSGIFTASFLTNLPRAITMYFGKGIVVPGLLIKGVNIKMMNRADRKSGLPIACEATLSLCTVVAFSGDDILAMFYSSGKGFGLTTPNIGGGAARAAGG